jgi:hypothetical protein
VKSSHHRRPERLYDLLNQKKLHLPRDTMIITFCKETMAKPRLPLLRPCYSGCIPTQFHRHSMQSSHHSQTDRKSI